RAERPDASTEHFVDEPIVEVEPLRVRRARPVREHARPRDAEAVRADAELVEQRDVVDVAVVVIACDVARVSLEHGALLFAEDVPHRGASAVDVGGPLDLVGHRRRAPHEIFGEGSAVAPVVRFAHFGRDVPRPAREARFTWASRREGAWTPGCAAEGASSGSWAPVSTSART